MNRKSQMAWLVAGLLAIGTIAIAGVTCESGPDGEGEPAPEAAASSESPGSDEPKRSSRDGGAPEGTSPGALPGEKGAKQRRPTSPGPKGAGVFFLAGLKGYLEPCGCTADVLLGGAERIVGYVQAARDLYTGALMLDAGDTFFEHGEIEEHLVPQEKAKADVIAAMHRAMETRATVPGERDFALGAKLYREKVEATKARLLGANMAVAGNHLEASATFEVEDWRLGVVGAAQPDLYDGIEGVEVTAPEPAIRSAVESLRASDVDVVLLLFHGDLKTTKRLVELTGGIDFAVVGHQPREPGGVDAVGEGHTLEAYDQGRYLGVLELWGPGGSRPFVNASPGSKEELEKIEVKITHVEESLAKLSPGKSATLRERLRGRLERLEGRRREIKESNLDVPDDRRSFLFRSVAMKPGFPTAPSIRKRRTDYNAKLEELTKQFERTVPEVEEGKPTYVGTNQCKTCHARAHEFWTGTLHAEAMATLEERDKEWDERCVKCHVVGYGEPGGSVLGKLDYRGKVEGATIRKNLRDVGCEACHGPGSKHRAEPVGSDGKPQFIGAGTGKSVCKQCHVQEHSPRFNYETYVRQITGTGHELSGAAE